MQAISQLVQSALGEKLYAGSRAARAENLRLAKRILRVSEEANYRQLAARLRDCRRDHRCGSPACAQCADAEKSLLESASKEFIVGEARSFAVAFATIIPPESAVSKGQLRGFDAINFKRRLRDGLVKTSARCAVGAVDITLNEHQRGLFDPHWAPHAHLMVVTNDINVLRKEMKSAFPRTVDGSRPVVVKEWDGDLRVLSYIFAVDFGRRISVENAQRFDPRTGLKRSCRATTYGRLRVSERVELAHFLDTVGLGGRLILRKARLYPSGASLRLHATTY
jgi:hypothetical protein